MLRSSVAVLALCISGISQSVAAAPNPLPDLDRNRLEYALSAIGELQKEWPGWKTQSPCILLFAEQEEWLINCNNPGQSRVAVESETLNNMPIFYSSHPVSLLHQQMPYAQVKQAFVAQAFVYLASDSSTIVYKDQPWFAISRLDDLAKNHPGFGSDTTTEEWLSLFVHEYFHIAQLTEPNTVAFMTVKSSQAAFVPQAVLAQFYVENPEYRLALNEEHKLLSNALSPMEVPLDKERARQTLSQWGKLYKQRINKYSKAFEKGDPRRNLELWDAYWTYLEGVARYVESKFLIDARYHSKSDLPGDARFSKFNSWEGKGYAGLPAPNKKMGRNYHYSIGMHLAFLLDASDPGWKSQFVSHRLWLIGMALDSTAPAWTP